MVNVAREAMLAVGCVQAQKCHTGECPTGVATQNPWLAHGLDPVSKGDRVANYVKTLRRDLLKVSETCGVEHPALIGPGSVEVLDNLSDGRLLEDVYGYQPGWGYPSERDRAAITAHHGRDRRGGDRHRRPAGDRRARCAAATTPLRTCRNTDPPEHTVATLWPGT